MTTTGSRLARVLRVLTEIGLVLSVLVGFMLSVALVVSSVRAAQGSSEGWATVMVTVGSSSVMPMSEVTLTSSPPGLIRDPSLVKAGGELRFRTDSWKLTLLGLVYLFGFLMVFFGFLLVRNILREVEGGTPFTPENGKRIRLLGVLFLAGGVLAPVIEFTMAQAVLSNVVTSVPALSPRIDISTDAIFAGLLLLVLSQIWVRGTEWEEDQALTV